MAEFTRTVWWRLTDDCFAVEVRYGIRVAAKETGVGGRDEAIARATELAAKHHAAEVREEKG